MLIDESFPGELTPTVVGVETKRRTDYTPATAGDGGPSISWMPIADVSLRNR